jgi:hypothetical protein
MWFLAGIAEEPTGPTIASWVSFFAFCALGTSGGADFLEDVLDVEEVVDEEGSLQARDSFLGQGGEVATVGALHHLSLLGQACHWLQALLTEDMEAVEEFGVCVLVQTYWTSQLFIQFL